MENKINVKIKQCYDTEENYKINNPVLLAGQLAYTKDKYGKYKIGDGISHWNDLDYTENIFIGTLQEYIDDNEKRLIKPYTVVYITDDNDYYNIPVDDYLSETNEHVVYNKTITKGLIFNDASHNYISADIPNRLSEYINHSGGTLTLPAAGSPNINVSNIADYVNTHRSGFYTFTVNGKWFNIISNRHRNGLDDGNKYGMVLYSSLTADKDYLYWDRSTSKDGVATWQGQRIILDSANYSSYALPRCAEHSNEWNFGNISNDRVWFNYRDGLTDVATKTIITDYFFGAGTGTDKVANINADTGIFRGGLSVATNATIKGTLNVAGNTTLSGSYNIIHNSYITSHGGTAGTQGYVRFMRIQVTASYVNFPISLEISGREWRPIFLSIRFSSQNNNQATINNIYRFGGTDGTIYYKQTSTNPSIYDFYMNKNESYGNIGVNRVHNRHANLVITYPGDQVNTLPSGCSTVGYGGEILRSWYGRDVTNGNNISFNYGASGLTQGSYSWLAAWNGYELRAISREHFLGCKNANGYYGMTSPSGDGAAWIRTTSNGIIPYQSGGAGSGHCSLGTSSWYFSNAYIDNVYTGRSFYLNNSFNYYVASSNNFELRYKNSTTQGVTWNAYPNDNNFIYYQPLKDNTSKLGTGDHRWNQIYSSSGSIYTSDKKKKIEISYIGSPSEYDTTMNDEVLIDFINGLQPVIYKAIDGESGRPHHGLIAQDIENLLKNLNINDHAAFIKSPMTKEIEYEEINEETGKKELHKKLEEIKGEYNYGLRYSEFVSDIIRYSQLLYNRLEKKDKQIASLEERLSRLESLLEGR